MPIARACTSAHTHTPAPKLGVNVVYFGDKREREGRKEGKGRAGKGGMDGIGLRDYSLVWRQVDPGGGPC